jgi:hypothetical protein
MTQENIVTKILCEKTEFSATPVPAPPEKFTRRVLRQGNSLALTIPVAAVEELNLREGDKIIAVVEGGRIYYEKVRR